MGLRPGREGIEIAPGVAPLPPEITANVIGVFSSLAMRLDAYDKVSKMNMDDVNADPFWAKAERFWDGTDWTARVRAVTSKGVEANQALR